MLLADVVVKNYPESLLIKHLNRSVSSATRHLRSDRHERDSVTVHRPHLVSINNNRLVDGHPEQATDLRVTQSLSGAGLVRLQQVIIKDQLGSHSRTNHHDAVVQRNLFFSEDRAQFNSRVKSSRRRKRLKSVGLHGRVNDLFRGTHHSLTHRLSDLVREVLEIQIPLLLSNHDRSVVDIANLKRNRTLGHVLNDDAGGAIKLVSRQLGLLTNGDSVTSSATELGDVVAVHKPRQNRVVLIRSQRSLGYVSWGNECICHFIP